jgi:CubicO group peptidase (beta-lactamase class C family)
MPDHPRICAVASLVLLACAAPHAATKSIFESPAPMPPMIAPVDPQGELATKLDPVFADFTQKGRSPGCSVGVYRAGEIVFSRGYGYADLEHDSLITDTTPFYTASLSKQFTAAAVLLLVGDGKVSLSDDVRQFIPELPDIGAHITLDELLHHTSGLRD